MGRAGAADQRADTSGQAGEQKGRCEGVSRVSLTELEASDRTGGLQKAAAKPNPKGDCRRYSFCCCRDDLCTGGLRGAVPPTREAAPVLLVVMPGAGL
jgi:hypothetical protein